jgi:hypothetical protein
VLGGGFVHISDSRRLKIEIVTTDLAARGLIEVNGDAVVLHPSAHEKFQLSQDGIPRITEIETWIEHVWFDLVSRNIMAPERSPNDRLTPTFGPKVRKLG